MISLTCAALASTVTFFSCEKCPDRIKVSEDGRKAFVNTCRIDFTQMPAMKFRAELLLERGMKGQSLRHAHRAFFLDDEEKDRAVALMRRVEAEVLA